MQRTKVRLGAVIATLPVAAAAAPGAQATTVFDDVGYGFNPHFKAARAFYDDYLQLP